MRLCRTCGKKFTSPRRDPDTTRCHACRKTHRELTDEKFGACVDVFKYCSACGRLRTHANSHHHFKCDRCWERGRVKL